MPAPRPQPTSSTRKPRKAPGGPITSGVSNARWLQERPRLFIRTNSRRFSFMLSPDQHTIPRPTRWFGVRVARFFRLRVESRRVAADLPVDQRPEDQHPERSQLRGPATPPDESLSPR